MSPQVNKDISLAAQSTVISTVLRILDKWHCTAAEKQALLGVGRSTLFKYAKTPATARLMADTLERCSYILNIHAALRTIFDNPENVYSFVRMPNHNPFFLGRSPLEVICSGRFADLYEAHKRIDALRGAQW